MSNYSINIAQMYDASDWRGLPAHRFFARLKLEDNVSEVDATEELHRMISVYPWPDYHVTLRSEKVVTSVTMLGSSAPQDFLDKHQWADPSVHKG